MSAGAATGADPAEDMGRGGLKAPPRHVAIIMDGNGRWAKARRLPRIAGHRAGAEAVRSVVETAPGIGIEVLTLYAFSSENWKRPEDEVGYLFGLLKTYLLGEIAELDRNDVRMRFIGDWRRLPDELTSLIEGAVERTRNNRGLQLVIALNYGSQDELVRVARALAGDAAAGRLRAEEIDAAAIEARLDTAGLPPLDLVIRTSGEQRLSNFLLWQSAYAEFVFTTTCWPDFKGPQLIEACAAFEQRERRHGGL